MGNELKLLVLLSSLLIATGPAWANWCTVTHIKFNKEYTKMEVEGEPFKIGKLDSSGHTMALVIDGRTSSYKFLREVTVDGLRFREFRNESMVFQLGTPEKNGSMLYSRFMKDSGGTERGFAGVCAGE